MKDFFDWRADLDIILNDSERITIEEYRQLDTEQQSRLRGYLKALLEEKKNHFNKEIVTTLMRFFMDSKLNKNGGTLIFSTHYPELLDEYDRNDSIYIIRNRNGITV